MKGRLGYSLGVFGFIGLPAVLFLLGAGLILAAFFQGLSTDINHAEAARTTQAVQLAINGLKDQIAAAVAAQAKSDEAYAHTRGPVDMEWVQTNWGNATRGGGFDTSFLLDGNGNVMAAFRNGAPLERTAESYYLLPLQKLIAALPRNGQPFAAQTTFSKTPDGIAVLGIAPVVPAGATEPDSTPANILLVSRRVDAAALQRLELLIGVKGLRLAAPAVPSANSLALGDAISGEVANVNWLPAEPAMALRKWYMLAGLAVAAAAGLLALILAAMRWLSQRETTTERVEIQKLSICDPLTGLAIRPVLINALAQAAQAENGSTHALLLVNLDGFRTVNETHGPGIGDDLLKLAGAGLSQLVKEDELVARLGGDEFAILTGSGNPGARAQTLAGQILSFFSAPFDIDGVNLSVAVSIGVAVTNMQHADPAELLRQAGVALHDAKTSGGMTFNFYEQQRETLKIANIRKANVLRQFMQEDRLLPLYQPVVSARKRSVMRLEAQLGWPEKQGQASDELEAIAEEAGLQAGLFFILLRKSLADITPYHGLELALRVSAQQLAGRGFIDKLADQMRRASFETERLVLVIHEKDLDRVPPGFFGVLDMLRELDVQVALGDFGTSHPGIKLIRQMRPDCIQLDKTLLDWVDSNAASRQLVHGTVLVAKGLSDDVIADGIETSEEASLMHLAGCTCLKGNYFGNPMNADDLAQFLQQKLVARSVHGA